MPSYNIAFNWDYVDAETRDRHISSSSDEDLANWASDPGCSQRSLCAEALSKREGKKKEDAVEKLAELHANPFDARTEVSADAQYIAGHIVKHLWIIFVVLPFVLAILFEILK